MKDGGAIGFVVIILVFVIFAGFLFVTAGCNNGDYLQQWRKQQYAEIEARKKREAEQEQKKTTVVAFEMTGVQVDGETKPAKSLWLIKESDPSFDKFVEGTYVVTTAEGVLFTKYESQAKDFVAKSKSMYLVQTNGYQIKTLGYPQAYRIGPKVGDPASWKEK